MRLMRIDAHLMRIDAHQQKSAHGQPYLPPNPLVKEYAGIAWQHFREWVFIWKILAYYAGIVSQHLRK